ncbi:MAG TPA: HlyD family efflux transporter periplasmic adaptor subunit [Telluria sp.]|nr:HlyD family efflux transporter periplasmic adaptor subunit [Telluria sp.]
MNMMMDPPAKADPLLQLIGLTRRARTAGSSAELAFMAVNDTRHLCAYRQAALWFADTGVTALSGVIEPEANAPYAQWLDQACRHLRAAVAEPCAVTAFDLPDALAGEWAEWLPAHALWLPFGPPASGGLLLAGEEPWAEADSALLDEWIHAWHHAWLARTPRPRWSWARLRQALAPKAEAPWWKQRRTGLALAVLAALLFPVHLSVLAPAELVSAHPVVIRAPVDGVIGQFQVQPNQTVKAGQALFNFDEASLDARRAVADQSLAAAHAEYRQFEQQAVSDTKSKAQLALLLGKIAEKRTEADYLNDQIERARVTSPQDGIALFDDPSEWVGRPVQTGERIMRIATPGDVEVEAWLPIGDAIALPDGAPVELYLAASPLSALSARVRYLAHDAVPRPDGSFAFRVRARLDAPTAQRVGAKGTVKISGDRVPLIYWIVRRPLATIRQHLGL